jgi:hypothetical protein
MASYMLKLIFSVHEGQGKHCKKSNACSCKWFCVLKCSMMVSVLGFDCFDSLYILLLVLLLLFFSAQIYAVGWFFFFHERGDVGFKFGAR